MSELPMGLELTEGAIRFPESSCAVVRNANGELLLVSQQRSAGRQSLEIPGGKVGKGETPETAALRELREECGILAEKAQLMLTLDLDLSVSVHRTHLVVVTGLTHDSVSAEFVPHWKPLVEALRMVLAGQLTHAPTVVATLLAGQGMLDGS